jgi:hypothetical protein
LSRTSPLCASSSFPCPKTRPPTQKSPRPDLLLELPRSFSSLRACFPGSRPLPPRLVSSVRYDGRGDATFGSSLRLTGTRLVLSPEALALPPHIPATSTHG